jgi:hypothetical protein
VLRTVVRQRLFIAASQRPDLYAYARSQFGDAPHITVFFDRRGGERRRRGRAATLERRQGERRRRPDVDEHLARLGYAIAFLE